MQSSEHAGAPMSHAEGPMIHSPYSALLLSIGVSFVAMYGLMYAMADRYSNVFANLSNVYMTGLMASSMLPIMLATMPGMFKDRRMNLVMWALSAGLLLVFWVALRTEAGVGDRQFLRAMIPHHSAAIQMCEQSALSDSVVIKLCVDIVASQRQEIATMKALLSAGK